MNALIRLFWRLSLFRKGPEDMPYAPPLLVILLVAWLIMQGLSANLQTSLPAGQLIAVQWISLSLVTAVTTAALAFKSLLTRWVQTMMALLGLDLLLSLVALPLLVVNMAAAQPIPIIDGLYFMLVSWQLAVQSFIYHRSLDVSPLLGLALAFSLLILTYMTLAAFMPEVLNR
ncbi:hypothetical protein [Alcanivorax sp. 24]|uniref:hypothetical protein n=1 Tax=Alcanivorax sp. 24 TaxID=2545266 RepID=UPI0010617653|nr:hypothetical protein [Alcanivorax sp. 24]